MKQLKALFAAASTGMMAAGLCLLLWPDLSAAVIGTVLGVISIACGLVRLAGYFSKDLYRLAFQFDLALGSLTVLIGLILILRPAHVLALLPTVIGVFILTDSVLRLQTAVDAKHFGMRKWWLILAVSLAGTALGLVLLLRPFESGRVMLRLTGASLLLDGVENLLAGLCTIKVPRRSSAS